MSDINRKVWQRGDKLRHGIARNEPRRPCPAFPDRSSRRQTPCNLPVKALNGLLNTASAVLYCTPAVALPGVDGGNRGVRAFFQRLGGLNAQTDRIVMIAAKQIFVVT